MRKATIAEIIEHGSLEMGIDLPLGVGALFELYYSILEERNQKVNLTAIKGREDVARLHFLDSLALLAANGFDNARVVDVGSGAGFPGVPLKLAKPTIDLTLIDASLKRIEFLLHLCAALRIDAECIHARAEEYARKHEMREAFDTAVSRALAKLSVLCELCLPFVRVGGLFLAIKSADSDKEIDNAREAARVLGAAIEKVVDYTIPDTDRAHRIVFFRKSTPTPDKYPRRFARIQKSPL